MMLLVGELALPEQHGRTGPGGKVRASRPEALGMAELSPPLSGCFRRAGPAPHLDRGQAISGGVDEGKLAS